MHVSLWRTGPPRGDGVQSYGHQAGKIFSHLAETGLGLLKYCFGSPTTRRAFSARCTLSKREPVDLTDARGARWQLRCQMLGPKWLVRQQACSKIRRSRRFIGPRRDAAARVCLISGEVAPRSARQQRAYPLAPPPMLLLPFWAWAPHVVQLGPIRINYRAAEPPPSPICCLKSARRGGVRDQHSADTGV